MKVTTAVLVPEHVLGKEILSTTWIVVVQYTTVVLVDYRVLSIVNFVAVIPISSSEVPVERHGCNIYVS